LLDRILNASIPITIPGTDETQIRTIRYTLRTAALRDAINDSDSGVYFDEKEKCLGVAWQAVKEKLFRQDQRFRRMTPYMLRTQASQMPDHTHISEARATQSGLLDRLKAKGMYSVQAFSIFNIRDHVTEAEKSQKLNKTLFGNSSNSATFESDESNEEEPDTGMNL